MGITIRDVAKAAGVSTASVSKVLHGRGKSVRVSDERAQQIRAIAEQLNYRPNVLARNLRTQSTRTVGLIFENFGSFAAGPLYYMHLLEGVGSVLFQNHYRLTILPELQHDDILGSLGDGQLDGVVWCKLARNAETLQLIHDCPIPIVALNAPSTGEPSSGESSDAAFVACDNVGGIRLAVEHLVALGHRRIAFVHEREDTTSPDCQERKAAFLLAMTELTHRVPTERDVLEWTWDVPEFAEWWRARPPHTAIIGWSERTAGALISRATDIGVTLPRELSIVGFDSTAYCETTQPRLTAVRQPIFEMARYATETVLNLIQGHRPENFSVIFPCGLDVRDSTAAPLNAETSE
ncbi:MAG: LacI family DNA-binding transcriptional regulator [Fimbriimonadaceae bacterium]|nr:LacI family DNA-binding transcriptional regulator [Fimbriimonadaceae bacterium]